MSVYEDILLYLEDMKIANVRKHFPFFICSGGAHLFNRINTDRCEGNPWKDMKGEKTISLREGKHIFMSHGLPVDTRGHIFFCAPPGFSKSFSMRVFAHPRYGVFANTDLDPRWEDRMTEARYSGTVYTDQFGATRTMFGAAYEYRNSILCVDEFHALSKAMLAEHSTTLESAICTSLDEGWIRKGLGRGKLEYKTQLTMWSGSQPLRYDLGQGIGRRFIFIEFIPSEEEEDAIRQAMRSGKNVRYDSSKLEAIRSGVRRIFNQLYAVETVVWDKSLENYLDKIRIMPYEEHLYNVIALGYTVMAKKFDKVLTVELDDELKRLFDLETMWRKDIKKGPETSQIIQILRDKSKNGQKWVPLNIVRDRMADFGVNYQRSTELIGQCVRERLIEGPRRIQQLNNEECICLR